MEPVLEYYAARLALGSLGGPEAVAAVDRLTSSGVWDDAFVDVLFAHGRQAHDVLAPFERALTGLGARVADRKDAILYLVDYRTMRMALSGCDPLDELETLMRELRPQSEFWEGPDVLGEGFGIERLVGIYYAWQGDPTAFTPVGKRDHEVCVEYAHRAREEAARWRASR